MSRYLGPLWKKSRSLQFSLLEGKEFIKGKKRTSRPGIHGKKENRRESTFAKQNRAKQKLCFSYGWRENQLKNLFKKVQKDKKKDTGTLLLAKCESRLDNIIYRSGIAPTRKFARQLVSHGHFLVEKEKTKIPSFQLKPGQRVEFRKKELAKNKIIVESLNNKKPLPAFISLEKESLLVTFLREPSGQDKVIEKLEKDINTALVLEWYNKKV